MIYLKHKISAFLGPQIVCHGWSHEYLGPGKKGGGRQVGTDLKGSWGLSYRFELQPETYGEPLNNFKQVNNIFIFASYKVHS